MEFKVRPANASDWSGVVATIHSVYDEYGFTWEEGGYHADLYDLDGYYLSKGHYFAVAESNTGIIGTIALELFPPVPGATGGQIEFEGVQRIAGCDCALNRLYVSPGTRRLGIAGALCSDVLYRARSRGCRAMEIWSDKRFEAAHVLYEKLGARVIGERICDDPDVSPEWGLILPLAPLL